MLGVCSVSTQNDHRGRRCSGRRIKPQIAANRVLSTPCISILRVQHYHPYLDLPKCQFVKNRLCACSPRTKRRFDVPGPGDVTCLEQRFARPGVFVVRPTSQNRHQFSFLQSGNTVAQLPQSRMSILDILYGGGVGVRRKMVNSEASENERLTG